MVTEEQVKKLLTEKLEGTDMFPVEMFVKPGNRIFIFMDGDHDVSIDDCIDVSRYIEQNLDREKEDFELNVSSVGVDKPFVMKRQYEKYKGRKIIVKGHDDKKFEAVLHEVTDDHIIVEPVLKKKNKKNAPSGTVELGFDEFKEAKGAVSFK